MRASVFVRVVVLVLVGLVMVPAVEAADRDKLLSEPGVYGTFAAFTFDEDWAKAGPSDSYRAIDGTEGSGRTASRAYCDRSLFDARIVRSRATCCFACMRPSCARPNSFSRSSGQPLWQASQDGRSYAWTDQEGELCAGLSGQLKADLKTASEPGPKPYVIVIPIRKNSDWWALDQDKRWR